MLKILSKFIEFWKQQLLTAEMRASEVAKYQTVIDTAKLGHAVIVTISSDSPQTVEWSIRENAPTLMAESEPR